MCCTVHLPRLARWLLRGCVACVLLATLAQQVRSQQESNAAEPVRCELAVVGGGSGGFGAALAAARLGVDVVLVERADCLGGNSVRSGVNCWEMGAGGTGIPLTLYQRLRRQKDTVGIYSFGRHLLWYDSTKEPYRYPGGETVIDPTRSYMDTLRRYGTQGMKADEKNCRELWHGVPFEPQAMAQTMLQMLRETQSCRVLLNTAYVSAACDDGIVTQIRLSNGRMLVADYFIDATGDGVLCLGAGCPIMSGQEEQERFGEPHAPPAATNRINGVTLLYRATRVDTPQTEALPDDVPAACWWSARFPAAAINHYPNGDLNINMLPTMDGAEFLELGYDKAYQECRRRMRAHWHYLQANCVEFRGYRISWTAPALGIRESRRIVGQYILTEHDLLAGISRQQHDDIICLADHALDTHGSHAHGIGELAEPYGVPYRCLIPQGQRNVLIACRAASFSSIAASSCRLSRTMMQLGEAAGTAVAVAKKLKVELPDVPPGRLRAQLRLQHVQLAHPMPAELAEYVREQDAPKAARLR